MIGVDLGTEGVGTAEGVGTGVEGTSRRGFFDLKRMLGEDKHEE
jgi:hypothetical protein